MAVPLAAVLGRLGPMLGRVVGAAGRAGASGGGGGGLSGAIANFLKDPKIASNIQKHSKQVQQLRTDYKELAKQGKDTKAVEMELTEAQEKLKESQAEGRAETQALTKGLGSLTSVAQGVAFKVGALKVAILGMAYAGGQGTVEMYRLQRQFHLINRNVFASLMPMFELLTKVVTKIRTFMQSMSKFQQDILLGFTAGLIGITVAIGGAIAGISALVAAVALLSNPIGWLVIALSAVAAAIAAAFVFSPGLRQEMLVLWVKLKELFHELKPLISITMTILVGSLKVVGTVLEYIVRVINIIIEAITRAVQKMKELVAYLPAIANVVPGLGSILNAGAGLASMGSEGSGLGSGNDRRYPRLMQTGTESLQGTFQRFQQEIFKVSVDKKEDTPEKSILDLLKSWDESMKAGSASGASMRRGSPDSGGSWFSTVWGGA